MVHFKNIDPLTPCHTIKFKLFKKGMDISIFKYLRDILMCHQDWKPFASCHMRQGRSQGEFKSPKWWKTITGNPDGIYGYICASEISPYPSWIWAAHIKKEQRLTRLKKPTNNECYLEKQRRQLKTYLWVRSCHWESCSQAPQPKCQKVCVPLKELTVVI